MNGELSSKPRTESQNPNQTQTKIKTQRREEGEEGRWPNRGGERRRAYTSELLSGFILGWFLAFKKLTITKAHTCYAILLGGWCGGGVPFVCF